jgi:hypothetical protein
MGIAHNRRAVLIRGLDTGLRQSAIFITFVLLAVLQTWPLASDLAHLSRNDNADAVLNEWIVAWVGHQAPRQPLKLFDANIFYPEPRTLAYSEYLIVPAVLAAPLQAAGASPVLVYNVLLLAGFTLTGWAGWALVYRWTGDSWAGLAAGIVLAFNAHTLTRLPQLQALHMEFLPLAFLWLERVLQDDGDHRRATAILMLAACMALQGVTSYYGLVLTVVALTVGWAVRGERRHVGSILIAAAISIVILILLYIPYLRLGQVRPLDEVAAYSASARDYLATPARIHFDTWSARFFGGTTALFPGFVAVLLSGVAIVSGIALRDRRARMALAFGLVGIALSFGPALPGYSFLYRLIPPLQGIRNAARFGYLATVATAMLSGFAVAWARERWRASRMMPALVAVVLLCANLDAFSGPIEYVPAEAVSPLHARLRGTGAIVAEIPVYPADRVFRNAPYLLHATKHWRPMLNGYSGLTPASYVQRARDLARFPDDHALETLRAIGVTHVFVHDRALRDWTDDETADAVPRAVGLELVERDGDVALYRVKR